MERKIRVGITHGDINGVGYEVILKTFENPEMLDLCTPIIYGSPKVATYHKKAFDNQTMFTVVSSATECGDGRLNMVNCFGEEELKVDFSVASPEAGRAALMSLERALDDYSRGYIDVLVTAPINKRAMVSEGFGYTGHTEYLQKEFGVDEVAMIMVSDQLKVGVVTGHIPLKDVPSVLTKELILKKLRLMKDSLERDFGIVSPKIAVLGLNPHCGDGGLLGDEEQEIILPAVQQAMSEGILAFGPYSPDGFFGLGNYSRYDAILAMYHDQGLTPFKALAFELGVNYTAGLPIVRTSPDHGTAYEMAGRDMADPRSMMSSIYTAIDIYNHRAAYDELQAGKMNVQMPDTEIRPKGGKIIE